VGALGDIGHEHIGVAALGLDRIHGALAAPLVEVDHRDLGALGGEQLGDLLADVAASAGDDRDLILELHRTLSLFLTTGREYMAHGAPARTVASSAVSRHVSKAARMDAMTATIKTLDGPAERLMPELGQRARAGAHALAQAPTAQKDAALAAIAQA